MVFRRWFSYLEYNHIRLRNDVSDEESPEGSMVINNKACGCYRFSSLYKNMYFTGQEWEAGHS